jgi:hypothetical protein
MIKKIKSIYHIALAGVLLSSCTSSLAPRIVKQNPNSAELEVKGKAIFTMTLLKNNTKTT